MWCWGGMGRADTHTWNRTAGLLFCQEIRQNEGSLPAGNFCFDFQLSLFYGLFPLIRILSQAPFCFSSSPSTFWLLFQLPGVMFIAVMNAGVTWLVAGIDPPVTTLLLSPSLTNPAALLAVWQPDTDALPCSGFVVCFSCSNLSVLCPHS